MLLTTELRETRQPMRASLAGGRWLVVPPGETFEVSIWFDNGDARIFWTGNREGLGGATVTASDLERCSRPA